ncbi:alpha/beta hydrolase [uncultured Bosea sp.]|uniref:alpha/beta hydrolase n=1 Tax=uncultured Bosea sp. TaxID=211457 RepID=UPI00263AA2E3|nr:alpha/beta hydrolase [uncultured Bosea sp.]
MSAVAEQTGKPENEAAARAKALYEYGPTSIYSSKHDPRFPYCLYVPPTLGQGGEKPELIVAMHGTGRGFTGYRDAFSAFARWNNCIILAPLFPIGVMGDGYRDGFKYMREGNLRYDHILLAIVEEVSERYGIAFDRFGLFGYSGGGHFAHRFLMLQPQKLWGVSIGAPGSVTLLDPSRDWWVGTRNFAELFGQELDIPAMQKVSVQMVVGAADLETWEITHKPGGRNWMPDANHAGTNRPERLASLRDNFAARGIAARFDLVPNTPHDGVKVVPVVEDFFAGEISRIRAARKAG